MRFLLVLSFWIEFFWRFLLFSIACLQGRFVFFPVQSRHLEITPVTLSAAKGLARRTQRSFAALRMTKQAHRATARVAPTIYGLDRPIERGGGMSLVIALTPDAFMT